MHREGSMRKSGPLTLKLLGGVQIFRANKSLHSLSSAKARALLVYLAVNQQTYSRDALAGLLWPDMADSKAKTNLRQVLTKLRQLLPEHLIITRQEVGLRLDVPLDVDALRFEEAVSAGLAGSRLRLEEAAELYDGDFLAGFYVEDAEFFDAWMVPVRERLRRLVLQALELLVEQASKLGQNTIALQYSRQRIKIEPWQEASHRLVMRLLIQEGRQSEALAQFEECRRILLDELDLEPTEETIALYEQIRGDSSDSDWAQPQSTQDWGAAPELPIFYGREAEVDDLSHWIDSGARVVTVLAMGGTGKTALATKVASSVADGFDFVFWRSLLNAPPIDDWLRWALQFLSRQQLGQLPTSMDERFTILFELLSQHRSLLILDNVESILLPGTAGVYRSGYEAYGQLVRRMAQSKHRSCLLLTSRERPSGIARLEEDSPQVRSLQLGGLPTELGQTLLTTRGASGPTAGVSALVDRYSGNPLALKLVADTIQELFDGDISLFLEEEMPIFDDIRSILEQQFVRLPALEQDVLVWLAIEREPVSANALAESIVHLGARRDLLEAVRGLQRRSLVDRSQGGFTLQNVITEYATEHLIEQICIEVGTKLLESVDPSISFNNLSNAALNRYPLLKTQAKEYLRESQNRIILQPVIDQLCQRLGREILTRNFTAILERFRADASLAPGYAGGNILNLLMAMGEALHDYSFANLTVWEAYLQGKTLPNVNFCESDLSRSTFTQTLDIAAINLQRDGSLLVGGILDDHLGLWQLVDGQLHRSFWQTSEVTGPILFSPDGRFLVSGTKEHSLSLWNVAEGHLSHTLHGHTVYITVATFSPDCSLLASADTEGAIYIWDTNEGLPLCRFVGDSIGLGGISFGPNGETLMSRTQSGLIRFWDVAQALAMPQSANTEQNRFHITEANNRVQDFGTQVAMDASDAGEGRPIAISPDGKSFATTSADFVVTLWARHGGVTHGGVTHGGEAPVDERHGWETMADLRGHLHIVRPILFDPMGNLIATGCVDGVVRIWDVLSGQLLHVLFAHTSEITSLCFSTDGKILATGGFDQVVRLWDVATGQALTSIQGYPRMVYSVAFSADGSRLVSGGSNKQVRLWDLQEAGSKQLLHALEGHIMEITTVAYMPPADRQSALVASGSTDHSVHLWDVERGQKVAKLRSHSNEVNTVVFDPNGQWLASGSTDTNIHLWNIDAMPQSSDSGNDVTLNQPQATLLGHTGAVSSVRFSPDGQLLASGSYDRTVCIWHVESGNRQHRLEGHTQWVTSVAFHPDGNLLASGSYDTTLCLWDPATGQLVKTIDSLTAPVMSIAFNQPSSGQPALVATANTDMTIRLWDLQTFEIVRQWEAHTNIIRTIAFRPAIKGHPQTLASASYDGTSKIWEISTGNCLHVLRDDGPYAGMNITGVTGISEAQKASLRALGAVGA